MIEPELLLLFFTSSLLLALAPGPDNLFVLTQAARQGRTAGLIVTLGLCTGLLVHTTAVALGLAAVLQTSEFALTVVKLMGAAYLLYLAYLNFRPGIRTTEGTMINVMKSGMLYRRGIIMNITNPKVSIFFLSFLPQFTNPQQGMLLLQFFLLGALFIVATVIVFGGISLLAGSLAAGLRRSAGFDRGLRWLTGSLFTLLALRVIAG